MNMPTIKTVNLCETGITRYSSIAPLIKKISICCLTKLDLSNYRTSYRNGIDDELKYPSPEKARVVNIMKKMENQIRAKDEIIDELKRELDKAREGIQRCQPQQKTSCGISIAIVRCSSRKRDASCVWCKGRRFYVNH